MVSATLAAPFVRRVDLVVGTSPQFFPACAAYVVSRYKRIPFVFELRDLWPESIKAVGAMGDSALLRLLERLELFLYRKAAAIVSVTHAFRRNLSQRGIDIAKVAVVTNGVDITRFRPRPNDPELVARYGLEGKFVAGYIGTHGLAHGLDTLLEAAAQLRSTAGGERFRLVLLGDGATKLALVDKAHAMGTRQRHLHSVCPQSRGGALLVIARCLYHSPQKDATVHRGHPLQALRVHGDGYSRVARGGRRIRRASGARGRGVGVRAGECSAARREPAAARAGRTALSAAAGALPGGGRPL
jgi:glycosyltransferase involved in cell wall biosynthesis